MAYEWKSKARKVAADLAEQYLDQILEKLSKRGEAPARLSDYSGAEDLVEREHMDVEIEPEEALRLLDDLEPYIIDDPGLFEGLPPRRALVGQALATYAAAIGFYFSELIRAINRHITQWMEDRGHFPVEGRKDWTPGTARPTVRQRWGELAREVIERWP